MSDDLPLFQAAEARRRREVELDSHEVDKAEFVAHARAVAFRLLETRASITIDDVRAECPPPGDVDPRVMGAVLRAPHFKRIGYRSSSRATCHARPIAIFARGDAT